VHREEIAVRGTHGGLHQPGIAGQSKQSRFKALADRGSDDHGTWSPHDPSRTRPNLTIITARHYSRVEDQSEGHVPFRGRDKASADELRRVGPFVGEAGTMR
jgi:hypothetical protein